MIKDDCFIEWCKVHSNFYGTSKDQITEIQSKKMIPLLDIDVQGAIKFEKVFPEANFVGLLPPCVETLKQRLKIRGTETEQSLMTRVKNADAELKEIFEKKDMFQFRVINNKLELASNTLQTLVLALYQQELVGKPMSENLYPMNSKI